MWQGIGTGIATVRAKLKGFDRDVHLDIYGAR